MAWQSSSGGALAALLMLLPAGCFIGYDSRWGQQKTAQQHLAAARRPTRLSAPAATGDARRAETLRTLRVRIEPTATYGAQVVDYERRFQKTLADANGVLEPALGVHLELGDTRPFKPQHGEDHIAGLLDDLRGADAGADVDWVIGLAGSIPRFEDSFHELGMGDVVGKHIVLRALNDVAEYRAFQSGLSELSEDERDKLLHARLAHKTAAVLLHELGHTLGALHELDKTNVMNPRYSQSEQHFGAETLDVMRVVLAHRGAEGTLDDEGENAVVALWRREPSPWVPAERAAEIARFSAKTAPVTAPATETKAAGLAPADESAFQEATRLLAAGEPAAAFRAGKPLFDAYPQLRPVAELRCNIAMKRGLAWEDTRRECADLMQGTFDAR